MEALRQVKLLLGRNAALRIRQPVVLALEMLWPVAIFLVVMAARKTIPPVPQPTCHYRAWSLPSSAGGVVPFVQSMICNIDDCQNHTDFEEVPTYKGSSVRDLVSHTLPLLSDPNITALVSALPKGMRLMRAAVDALSGPDLAALLGDGFPVQNLLRNVNQSRELLQDIKMPSEDIDAILNSSIQLPQVLEMSSRGEACGALPPGPPDSFDKFRRHLCTLDEGARGDFFRRLREQIDVKSIVQALGLAMSELGRLDVGEILGSVGGLLAHLQSARFLHEDALRLASAMLAELRRVDARLISLVIDDLEPLYGDSQWAPIIRGLKDIKLNRTSNHLPNTRRFDISDNTMSDASENEAEEMPRIFDANNSSGVKQNSSDALKTFLDVLESGLDVIKFLPQPTALQLQRTLKFFPVLMDMAEELKNSLRKDNSTLFINTLSDVLGAVFLSIADGAKSSDSESPSHQKFCDKKEFPRILNSSEWQHNRLLQRYMCRISKASEKDSVDAKMWSSSLDTLREILDAENYNNIQRNLLRWQEEGDGNIPEEPPFSKLAINEGNIDDVITTFECIAHEIQDISHIQGSMERKNNSTHQGSAAMTFLLNNQERLLLLGLIRAKELSKYLRFHPLFSRHSNDTKEFGDVLTELSRLLNGVAAETLLPTSRRDSKDLYTNSTLREGVAALLSAFIGDLESHVWKSITPKMVEEFSSEGGREFCVEAGALEASQLHWKWMLCGEEASALRIPLPNARKTMPDPPPPMPPPSGVVRLAAGVVSRMLGPVSAAGCEPRCGGRATTRRKMCFLGRLRGAKGALRTSGGNATGDDSLERLLPPTLVEVVNIYDTLSDVLRTSAVENQTDWKNIAHLVVSVLRVADGGRNRLRVVNSLVSLLKNRLSDAAAQAQGGVVEIRDVFPDSPLTQEVVRSLLPLLPEVTTTALWTAMAHGKLLRLVKESERNISVIMSALCNSSSLSDFLYNPALGEQEFGVLGEALCRHHYYDVFEEIFQDPDIQEIVFEGGDSVSWEDMQDDLLEISSLLRDLTQGRGVDPSSLPPLPRWQKAVEDVQAHAARPTVLLHVAGSALFGGFCRGVTAGLIPRPEDKEDGVGRLSRALCALSSREFARGVVAEIGNLGERSVWEAVKAVPEIQELAQVALGSNSSSGVRERVLNATERVFDLVDSASGGKLSAAILDSSIPEVLDDLSSSHSGGAVSFEELLRKGGKSDQVFRAFLETDHEKRRLGSYVQTFADYFSRDGDGLRTACGRASGEVRRVFCSRPPSQWGTDQLRGNATALRMQLDAFLPEEAKNATRGMFLLKRKAGFLTSLDRMLASGLRVSDWSSIGRFPLYFDLARSFVRSLNSTTFQGTSCVTRSTEAAVRHSTQKLMDSIRDSEYLSCDLQSKNISEFYAWFSKSSDLKAALEKVSSGQKSGEECRRNSWQWLSPLVDDLERLLQNIHGNLTAQQLARTRECLANFTHSTLFTSFNVHAGVLQQTAKVLSSLDAPVGIWKSAKEQILENVSQHLPAFLKISEVVSPTHETSELEERVGNVSINFNWLSRHRFSAAALAKRICGAGSPPWSGVLSPHPSAEQAADFFCSDNGTEELVARINRTAVAEKVAGIQEREFFSGDWFRQLVDSSPDLVDLGSQLASSLGDLRVTTPFDALHLVADARVMHTVAEGFERLVRVLDPVFPASSLIETLRQIAEGLDALKSLAKLTHFSFTYPLGEVFGVQEARAVLLEEMGMENEAAYSILETEINLTKVKTDHGRASFCESADDVSVLCSLSSNPRTAVAAEWLQDLVLQKFLLSFGALGIEGVLRSADVDSAEAGRTLATLSSAPEVVATLSRHLETITDILHPEVGEVMRRISQDPEWMHTPEALSLGGRIVCGRPLISLSRRFLLLAPPEDAAPHNADDREAHRLPTDFCRRGYREIMGMRGGAILWGFLKPLFRGKILYAPKNHPTARLVVAKVNETFGLLADHVQFLRSAAEGTTGLHYLQRKGETLKALRKLVSSRGVSRLLGGSSSWGSALSWLEGGDGSAGRPLLRLVELVGNVTQCISLDRFLGFDTEDELEAAAATLHDRREFIAALVFMDEDGNRNQRRSDRQPLPKNVLYKIRMDIDNVPTTEHIKYRWWRPYPYDDFFEDLRYFRGFLQLQDAVDSAITDLQLGTSLPRLPTNKYLQQFPYPCHQRDKFGTLLKGSMPAVMTISWVFIVAFLVRERVLDRELELEETLRVMGVRGVSSWLAWFVSGLLVLLGSVSGIVAVLTWGGVTPHSDPLLLFLFVADFALLLVAYCQLMSTFFERASTAALLSVLLYVLSFFPFLLFVTWELDFLYWQKMLSCCLVSTSFCFGCLYLNRFEDQGHGVQWSNLWSSPVEGDRLNFGTTLVAMLLCAALYFALAVVVSAWRDAGGFRGMKPLAWYALFRPPVFSQHSPRLRKQKDDSKNATSGSQSGGGGEKSGGSDEGISLRDVHAIYRGRGKWRALSGLNLELKQGSITALLGHNGAGKTTTIKILTGRLRPTSGIVRVCGLSLPRQTDAARRLIGFCPQGNTLYDKLTVKEHLNLFARLKGLLDEESVEKDVEDMLDRLRLREKRDEYSCVLSGGQRRRLCVGAAFVGGSRVVVLDEPTSSVDPVARRAIWDLVLSYRKGRTILFTTHHLDEADILSDRVAILHKGRVLCSGSPLELKSRFGSGYRLSLLPRPDKRPLDDNGEGVMCFVHSHVPDATLLECGGGEGGAVVVSLPAEPLSRKPLSPFFAKLEQRLHEWGFHSYSLASATLEEVFLTLCRLEDAKAAHNSDKFSDMSPFREPTDAKCIPMNDDTCKKGEHTPDFLPPPSSPVPLKLLQLRALVLKRAWHVRANWRALASGVLLPCLFIALAMGLAVGRPQKAPDPAIELTPDLYSSAGRKGVSFFEFENPKSVLARELLSMMRANDSISEICDESYSNCGGSEGGSSGGSSCLCERECRPTPRPSSLLSAPRHLLYNMSGVDVPDYLLHSYLHFNEKRYGGWSLSEEGQWSKVWFENSGYHSAPAYLNTLNNAILKSTSPDLGIRTWSHPLRLSIEQLGRETLFQRLGEVGISFVFLIGLSLVPCTFAVFAVSERESEQRRLLAATGGVGPLLYWTAALLCDGAVLLLTSALCALVVAVFRLPAFYHRDNFRAVFALIFLYGWATTPLTYLCCRLFHEGSLAFMVLFTGHLFAGLVIMLALVSLRMVSITKDVSSILSVVQRVSLAFPQYSLIGGLTDLNENQIRTDILAQFGQDAYVPPLGWGALGPNAAALFAQGCLFFALTVAADCAPALLHWWRTPKRAGEQRADEEKKDSLKSLLQIRNVSQVYHTKAGRKHAVDHLTLTIPHGECFGLVGANGAGKTTLFRLLIGETRPTSGEITSSGLRRRGPRFLGYCPQKDALDGMLSPRQHLLVYAGIRGIGPEAAQKVVDASLRSVELLAHADAPVSALSGGTKRKLCTAIATLGDPQLILLDEPTSGMDPATRRLVWKCIARATEAGRAVVLTSHSIDDCDVLCSRLGIMVNGQLACADTTLQLKNRLGRGYTLSLSLPPDEEDARPLLHCIQSEMPEARVQVHSGRRVEMSLPDEAVLLSRLFSRLEECARRFGIEDIALHPTTLDQVFVNFVRQQSDAVDAESPPPQPHVPTNEVHLEMCSTKL